MRTPHAILAAGALIAVSSAGTILYINRYEIAQPFDPQFFKRYDRWTGRVEYCSSMYDNKTYCGPELFRRSQQLSTRKTRMQTGCFSASATHSNRLINWPRPLSELCETL